MTDARLGLLRDLRSELQMALRKPLRGQSSVAIHDARVAARRLRAVLRSLRDEVNQNIYAQLRFDLTNLGRELADIRTADMHLQMVSAFLADTPRASSMDRTNLRTVLERTASSARKSLAHRMREDPWKRRLGRIAAAIEDEQLLLRPTRPAPDEYRAMLSGSIAETLHALRKGKTNIRGLHKQRIRIKSTRYVCEVLAPLIELDARRPIAVLCKAQDILGELHDQSALVDWLKTAPVPTPLLDRLTATTHAGMSANRKRFQRVRPELHRRLRKLAKVC